MKRFRMHVVGLPHTQTTKDFNSCAYTQKVRKFCNMMSPLGHEIYLYAGDQNEAEVTELVICITRDEQREYLSEYEWFRQGAVHKMPYDENHILWRIFNYRVVKQIARRYKPGDFVLLITGKTQQEIVNNFPYASVEYGVGYTGITTNIRVYESYAWMNYLSGRKNLYINRQFDEVIPNYFEVDDFPFNPHTVRKKEQFLFMSRPIPQKGTELAVEIARRSGKKLIMAGPEKPPQEYLDLPYVKWIGYVDTKSRAKLLGESQALLCPTLYIEPFGGVVVESQLCGTPVLTTDWGAFAENVQDGKTGYRCHTIDEFMAVVGKLHLIRSEDCRNFAMQYSTGNIADQYQAFFERIHKMWKSAHMI